MCRIQYFFLHLIIVYSTTACIKHTPLGMKGKKRSSQESVDHKLGKKQKLIVTSDLSDNGKKISNDASLENISIHELSVSSSSKNETNFSKYKVRNSGRKESIVNEKDTRYKVEERDMKSLPYKAICKLYTTAYDGKQYIGTGWLISNNKVITAGHCVYDHNEENGSKGWAKSIFVIPGMYGTTKPFGVYEATKLFSLDGWTRANPIRRYDMGAILLASPVQKFGQHFIVPRPLKRARIRRRRLKVCGYPGDREEGMFQYEGVGDISKIEDGIISYKIDTNEGQSGGPVWIASTNSSAIGIHNYGAGRSDTNKGSALYELFITRIKNWN